MQDFGNILKISRTSNPNSVAGAIAAIIKDNPTVELHCVGAGAINQAVKAIAIARGFTAPQGTNLVAIPAFIEVNIESEEKSGIRFIVKDAQ